MPAPAFYDKASTVYYPYNLNVAKAELAKAGLKDTDGDGIVNFPEDTPGVGGQDVSITLLANSDYQTDKNLAEGVVAVHAEDRHPRHRRSRLGIEHGGGAEQRQMGLARSSATSRS